MSHSKGQNPDLAQTPALLSATSALSNFFPIYTVNSNQMHQCFIFPKITSANTPAWSILTWPTFANKGHDNHVNSTQRSRTHCKMSFFFFLNRLIQGSANFSIKSQRANTFSFVCQMVSIARTWFCLWGSRGATDSTLRNGCGSIPIKPYGQRNFYFLSFACWFFFNH